MLWIRSYRYFKLEEIVQSPKVRTCKSSLTPLFLSYLLLLAIQMIIKFCVFTLYIFFISIAFSPLLLLLSPSGSQYPSIGLFVIFPLLNYPASALSLPAFYPGTVVFSLKCKSYYIIPLPIIFVVRVINVN